MTGGNDRGWSFTAPYGFAVPPWTAEMTGRHHVATSRPYPLLTSAALRRPLDA